MRIAFTRRMGLLAELAAKCVLLRTVRIVAIRRQ